jgi:hypothetical protein
MAFSHAWHTSALISYHFFILAWNSTFSLFLFSHDIFLFRFLGLCLGYQAIRYGCYVVPSVSLSCSTASSRGLLRGKGTTSKIITNAPAWNLRIRFNKSYKPEFWEDRGRSFRRFLSRRKRCNQEWLICISSNQMYVIMHLCVYCIKCTMKYNKILVICFDEMLHALLV